MATDHPRLYFTDASLPAVRANAANAVDAFFGKTGKQLWDELEGTANGYLTETSFPVTYYGGHVVTYPLPPEQPSPMPNPPGFHEGVYPYWTLMSRGVEMRLETLSLAYAVTEDEDYADKAKAYMLAVAEWDTWTDPTYSCAGTTCLDTAHLTFGVGMAYDILYDLLTEPERAAVRAALDVKGLAPLYADVKNKFDHNLQMLRASALASGASAVLGELPDAHKYLTGATDYFQWYLDARMESGQQEGMLYTSYSVDNMIRGLDHLSRVTGLRDYIEHPFFDDFLVRWSNYFLAPGGAGLANFSDSSIANFYSLSMLAVNSWLGSGEAGWYLEETKGGSDTFSQFLFYRPQPPVSEPNSWPRSAVLDEIGWAALRSGWEKEDTLLAFVSNNSRMGHNHYDQNSFQIAVNGSWIAGDPGYQDFTPGAAHDFTVRLGHSTIQADGMGQSKLGGGSLTTGMLAETYDYVKGSAAGAYDNPKLTKYDRHIVYVNSDYFVMLDDLQANAEHEYDWVLYNGDLYDFSVDGVQASAGQTYQGSELWFTNGKASMQVKFLGDTPLPMKVDKYAGAESYGYYTKVGSGTEAEAHRFLTVLKAKPFHSAGYLQAEDLVPPHASSGKTYSVFNAANRELVFYPADQIGDYITYSVNVDQAGTYSLSTLFIQSPLYGQVQAYVDGQPVGGAYDGYNATVQAAAPFAHGDVTLSAGSHTIQYKVTGKNAGSGNYFIGIDAISVQPAGSQGPGQQPEALDASLLTGTGATGAEVNRADGSGLTDYVVFKTGSAAYTIAGVASDADQAIVTANASGCCSGFSMTKGTSLAYNGATLLESQQPFNASFAADQTAVHMKGTVETGAASSISIHSAFAPAVTINGTPLSSGQIVYDASEELVTIEVPAGTHEIVLAAPAP